MKLRPEYGQHPPFAHGGPPDSCADQDEEMKEPWTQALLTPVERFSWQAWATGSAKEMVGWKQFTGQSIQEAEASGWQEAIHPEDRARLQELWQLGRTEQPVYEVLCRVRHRSGEYHLCRMMVLPITGADGQIFLWAGCCADVTERQRSDDLLLGQALLLEHLAQGESVAALLEELALLLEGQIDEARCSILLVDADKKRLWRGAAPNLPEAYNQIVEQTEISPHMGSCGAAVYRKAMVVVTDIASDPLWAPYREVARSFQLRACWSMPIVVTTGQVMGSIACYFSTPRTPTSREKAQLALATHLAGIVLEHTQQQEVLYKRERHFRALIEKSWDAIQLSLPDGTTIFASPSSQRVQGYAPEELQQMDYWDLVHPQDRESLRIKLTQLLDEPEQSQTAQYRIRQKNGTWRWIEATATNLLQDPDVGALVVNYRDISERVESEQRKDEFLSLASHELKTPLTSITVLSHILHRRAEQQQESTLLPVLTQMEYQIGRMTRLLHALLDISRLQTGTLELHPEVCALHPLLQETVREVQQMVSQCIELQEDSVLHVWADRDRIGQVLTNLLTNACKYSPATERVVIRVSRNQEQAVISVQDAGIGIAQEHLEQIFERFYQVRTAEAKPFAGLGLGLYISKQIIEQHQGQMWVESTPGEGSTFSFSLPLAREPETSSP